MIKRNEGTEKETIGPSLRTNANFTKATDSFQAAVCFPKACLVIYALPQFEWNLHIIRRPESPFTIRVQSLDAKHTDIKQYFFSFPAIWGRAENWIHHKMVLSTQHLIPENVLISYCIKLKRSLKIILPWVLNCILLSTRIFLFLAKYLETRIKENLLKKDKSLFSGSSNTDSSAALFLSHPGFYIDETLLSTASLWTKRATAHVICYSWRFMYLTSHTRSNLIHVKKIFLDCPCLDIFLDRIDTDVSVNVIIL